jgi:hypothetical protein
VGRPRGEIRQRQAQFSEGRRRRAFGEAMQLARPAGALALKPAIEAVLDGARGSVAADFGLSMYCFTKKLTFTSWMSPSSRFTIVTLPRAFLS